jgi:hypothetical protein
VILVEMHASSPAQGSARRNYVQPAKWLRVT